MMSNHVEQQSPERYAIEQAISRLENDKDRVDAFMTNMKWLVSTVGSLALVVIAVASFVGISSVSDIREELSRNVKTLVAEAIDENELLSQDIKDFHNTLREAKTHYEENRAAIESLSLVAEMKDVEARDPQFAYDRLKRLEHVEATVAERGTAIKLLEAIIEAGQRGIADPNLLFNASTMADRFNLHFEALKLAVLAEYWRPSLSHQAKRAQNVELLDRDFQYREGKLHEIVAQPGQVRKEAWKSLMELIGQGTREESEQMYSRTWNVAVRNRSGGYFQTFIDKIKEVEKLSPVQMTSYAYVMLARLIAHQGSVGWKAEYEEAVHKAVRTLRLESPFSTWYKHSQSELGSLAGELAETVAPRN